MTHSVVFNLRGEEIKMANITNAAKEDRQRHDEKAHEVATSAVDELVICCLTCRNWAGDKIKQMESIIIICL